MNTLFADILIPITSQPALNQAIEISPTHIKNIHTNTNITSQTKQSYSLIIPGYINNHLHVSYQSSIHPVKKNKQLDWMHSLVSESRPMTNEQKISITQDNIQHIINTGTTFIVDNTPFIETATEIIKSPLKSLIGYEVFGINFKDNIEFENCWNEYLKSYEHLNQLVNEYSNASIDQITFSPHSVYTVGQRMLQQVSQWSKQTNNIILLHLAEFWFEKKLTELGRSPDVLQAYHEKYNNNCQPSLSLGELSNISPVEYLDKIQVLDSNLFLTHMIEVNNHDIELLQKYNTSVVLCPRSNAYLYNQKSPCSEYIQNNIKYSIATDGLSSNYSLDLLDEIRFAKLYYQDITAKQLFESITINPAMQLNKSQDIGSIERNKSADLLEYNISPALYAKLQRALDHGEEYVYETLLRELNNTDLKAVYINGVNCK